MELILQSILKTKLCKKILQCQNLPKDVTIHILKDAKILDAFSSALEDNEYSPSLTRFVIQTWRRSLKARIQLSKSDNGNGDEVIGVNTTEVIDEQCRHVVIDLKHNNKYVQNAGSSIKNGIVTNGLKALRYHNQECFTSLQHI